MYMCTFIIMRIYPGNVKQENRVFPLRHWTGPEQDRTEHLVTNIRL